MGKEIKFVGQRNSKRKKAFSCTQTLVLDCQSLKSDHAWEQQTEAMQGSANRTESFDSASLIGYNSRLICKHTVSQAGLSQHFIHSDTPGLQTLKILKAQCKTRMSTRNKLIWSPKLQVLGMEPPWRRTIKSFCSGQSSVEPASRTKPFASGREIHSCPSLQDSCFGFKTSYRWETHTPVPPVNYLLSLGIFKRLLLVDTLKSSESFPDL